MVASSSSTLSKQLGLGQPSPAAQIVFFFFQFAFQFVYKIEDWYEKFLWDNFFSWLNLRIAQQVNDDSNLNFYSTSQECKG